jgi:quercetin dioxygenase-like cupin family protein
MIYRTLFSMLALAMCASAYAQTALKPPPRIHAQDGDSQIAVQWRPQDIALTPVGKPGISSAVLVGAVEDAGVYLVRVHMEPGAVNAAHVHPDARVTTIMSGTVIYGLGPSADRTSGVSYGPGSVYFTPPNMPHWLIATDEPVVYEEAGFGPSNATPVTGSKP